MAEIAKSTARAPDLIDIDAVETAINKKDCPYMELIDEEIDKLIAKGLDESRTLKPTEKINLPLITSILVFQAQLCTSSSGKEPIVVDLSASQACPNTPSPSVPNDTPSTIECNKNIPCLPELQSSVETEQRRAAQIAANIEICTAAINSFEAPLSNGTRYNFVASLKVYIRSMIAQFQRSDIPIIRKSTRNTPTTKAILTNAAKNLTRSTWATIANKVHQEFPAIPNMSQNPTSKMTGKGIAKSSSLSGADERFFLHIARDYEWRLKFPCVVRENYASF
ncbi:hypothetical protein EPUL_002568 [Erysiphe pulchra]|uniref:Uncharacterized protein n=1 Tax=Erysiphe pulchra TaxID=225359 RepID=A0A2S4PPY6_9PEZI|nr:hypothetical protein EPUL_002568 [Erysiphe pulchra]